MKQIILPKEQLVQEQSPVDWDKVNLHNFIGCVDEDGEPLFLAQTGLGEHMWLAIDNGINRFSDQSYITAKEVFNCKDLKKAYLFDSAKELFNWITK